MIGREFHFHDGKKGAALAVRLSVSGKKSSIKKVLKDGTVTVVLNQSTTDPNQALIRLLSQALNIPEDHFEIIAGEDSKEKLISILDIKPEEVQQIVLNLIN
jgi:uncharacterized protein YggU (UPF0235/DUF167 family)